MTPDIIIVLSTIVAGMILFATEKLPVDLTALLLLVFLIITGSLPPERAFLGFGSDTFILFLGLFIMSAALMETRVVETIGRRIMAVAGSDANRLLAVIMVSVCTLSAFMSNTAATAFFVPIVYGLARRIGKSPSRFLMPLAFASILSSSVTVISSSTNIVVSQLLTQNKMPPLGMFELAPVGIVISIVGLLYMWFVARHLIPDRTPAESSDVDVIGIRPYLSEIVILHDSPLVGKTLGDSPLQTDLGLTVIRVIKGKTALTLPVPWTMLEEGDVLLVEGDREKLLLVKSEIGIDLTSDSAEKNAGIDLENITVAEAVIMPGSWLIGRTLKGSRFRQRYNAQVLGLNRRSEQKRTKLSQIVLREGDVLLVQGDPQALKDLDDSNVMRMLTVSDAVMAPVRKGKIALLIFAAAVIAGASKIVTLPVAMLTGGVAVLLSGCISTESAYRKIEWRALILVACMLGVGEAMVATEADKYVASLVTAVLRDSGHFAVLSVFFLIAVVLTQPLSNQAAAILLIPIAIQTAVQLNLNPRSLAAMITIAASCSFITPLEPSCLMVYGPGNYRFFDFVKVGLPLTLLIYAIAVVMVPYFWPLGVQ